MRRSVERSRNDLKPHLKRQWVIPPKKNAAFVWRMEEVLDLYEEPYDPLRPMVCCRASHSVSDPRGLKTNAHRFTCVYASEADVSLNIDSP